MDLGDRTDIPDHTQDFIDLRGESRDRDVHLPVHEYSHSPAGHRVRNSTRGCYY